jgi:DNA-binding MurR/RpiR family transcriptional regulator
MALPSLTALEAKVVESVLERKSFDETTSLKEVAEAAGVSEAMVTKISKKLGFSGFRDFRAGLAEYIRLPTADLHELVARKIKSLNQCGYYFMSATLRQDRRQLAFRAFLACVQLLRSATKKSA